MFSLPLNSVVGPFLVDVHDCMCTGYLLQCNKGLFKKGEGLGRGRLIWG